MILKDNEGVENDHRCLMLTAVTWVRKTFYNNPYPKKKKNY